MKKRILSVIFSIFSLSWFSQGVSGFDKVINEILKTAGSNLVSTLREFSSNRNISMSTIDLNHSNINMVFMPGDYEYIPPQGWQVQDHKDYLQFQNIKSGCLIQVFVPQPSSGNLEQDVAAVFELMYKDWQFQNKDEKRFTLSKGFLPKGLEYCMIEAPMSRNTADGRYQLEEGAALVVKANNQIAIISARHNASMMGHEDCWKKYETWRRFFNSFTVKNVAIPNPTGEENTKRIVGVWKLTGHGVAAGDYIFAANGSYQFGGAVGTSSTSSDFRYEYLHLTSYSWQGDGSFTLVDNQLSFKKRGANEELIPFRFEKVNHGGTGWKDRLYLLKTDSTLGNKYETCYEKSDAEKN